MQWKACGCAKHGSQNLSWVLPFNMYFTLYFALLFLFIKWSRQMYTWSVDPENSPRSAPAMLAYPALKTWTLNLLSALQKPDLFPQTLQETELATCYSAGWLVQGERKGSSGVELFVWELSFQKYFCIENEGFMRCSAPLFPWSHTSKNIAFKEPFPHLV